MKDCRRQQYLNLNETAHTPLIQIKLEPNKNGFCTPNLNNTSGINVNIKLKFYLYVVC